MNDSTRKRAMSRVVKYPNKQKKMRAINWLANAHNKNSVVITSISKKKITCAFFDKNKRKTSFARMQFVVAACLSSRIQRTVCNCQRKLIRPLDKRQPFCIQLLWKQLELLWFDFVVGIDNAFAVVVFFSVFDFILFSISKRLIESETWYRKKRVIQVFVLNASCVCFFVDCSFDLILFPSFKCLFRDI